MAYGYDLEAEYADGYVHSERDRHDESAFEPHRNVFYDICKRLLEPEHGALVRFSALNDGSRPDADEKCYDQHIDWRDFPDNAKPIYYRRVDRDFNAYGWTSEPRAKHFFGFEYHNLDGSKVKQILEL